MIRQRNFCTNAIRKIDIIITIKKPFSYFITKNVNRNYNLCVILKILLHKL